MKNALSEIMLRANTALFAQKVTQTINDFFMVSYEIQARSLSKGLYKSSGNFAVVMHFSGAVQGDFIINTDEKTAEKLAFKSIQSTRNGHDFDSKTCISDHFTELLNISAGQTLPELEKKYGTLLLIPPLVIFGELRQSQVISGNVDIRNGDEMIRCTLSLNLSGISRLS